MTKLRSKFSSLLDKTAHIASKARLTPNMLTSLGFFIAILSAVFYLKMFPVIAGALFLLSGFLDAVDGSMARTYGQVTELGGFLDSILDRASDAIVYSSVVIAGYCGPRWEWGLAAIVCAFLVSYTRARAEGIGIKMEGVGIAERAERILILAFASFLVTVWAEAILFGLIAITILSLITIFQRVLFVYKALAKKLLT